MVLTMLTVKMKAVAMRGLLSAQTVIAQTFILPGVGIAAVAMK
jgi:hypothetical protein